MGHARIWAEKSAREKKEAIRQRGGASSRASALMDDLRGRIAIEQIAKNLMGLNRPMTGQRSSSWLFDRRRWRGSHSIAYIDYSTPRPWQSTTKKAAPIWRGRKAPQANDAIVSGARDNGGRRNGVIHSRGRCRGDRDATTWKAAAKNDAVEGKKRRKAKGPAKAPGPFGFCQRTLATSSKASLGPLG